MKGSFQREERSIGKMQRNKMTANTGGMVCYIIYYYFMKVFLVIFFSFAVRHPATVLQNGRDNNSLEEQIVAFFKLP